MCIKGCIATATFDEDGEVAVRVRDGSGMTPYDFTGQLTPDGQRAVAAYASVEVAGLEKVYGCPDCTDGGAAFLSWGEGGPNPVNVTFEYGLPPAQLSDAFAFTDRVIRTLMTCGESPDVVATPPLQACNRYAAELE
jgi:hypothetical protein